MIESFTGVGHEISLGTRGIEALEIVALGRNALDTALYLSCW